ncbi:MAG: hypothetical protein FJZ01_07515 [Candidatus Sericytochromatia bacterium]|nr:hypothetical protein [Candidatus Tanganyikabacteria bacterium]
MSERLRTAARIVACALVALAVGCHAIPSAIKVDLEEQRGPYYAVALIEDPSGGSLWNAPASQPYFLQSIGADRSALALGDSLSLDSVRLPVSAAIPGKEIEIQGVPIAAGRVRVDYVGPDGVGRPGFIRRLGPATVGFVTPLVPEAIDSGTQIRIQVSVRGRSSRGLTLTVAALPAASGLAALEETIRAGLRARLPGPLATVPAALEGAGPASLPAVLEELGMQRVQSADEVVSRVFAASGVTPLLAEVLSGSGSGQSIQSLDEMSIGELAANRVEATKLRSDLKRMESARARAAAAAASLPPAPGYANSVNRHALDQAATEVALRRKLSSLVTEVSDLKVKASGGTATTAGFFEAIWVEAWSPGGAVDLATVASNAVALAGHLGATGGDEPEIVKALAATLAGTPWRWASDSRRSIYFELPIKKKITLNAALVFVTAGANLVETHVGGSWRSFQASEQGSVTFKLISTELPGNQAVRNLTLEIGSGKKKDDEQEDPETASGSPGGSGGGPGNSIGPGGPVGPAPIDWIEDSPAPPSEPSPEASPGNSPTPSPSSTPASSPTPAPTATPTPTVAPSPTAEPTSEPTSEPTPTPSPTPTATPAPTLAPSQPPECNHVKIYTITWTYTDRVTGDRYIGGAPTDSRFEFRNFENVVVWSYPLPSGEIPVDVSDWESGGYVGILWGPRASDDPTIIMHDTTDLFVRPGGCV